MAKAKTIMASLASAKASSIRKRRPKGKCKVKLNEKEKAQAAAKRAVEKFKKSKDFQKCVHQAAVLLHDKWICKTMNKMSLMTMNMYSQQKNKVCQKSKTKNGESDGESDDERQPGESFRDCEARVNSLPPGVPQPRWPLTDFTTQPPFVGLREYQTSQTIARER